MKSFANKAAPLRAMMKDKVNFVWDETHQKVFEDIKLEVAKHPTLSAFNSSLNVERYLLPMRASMVWEPCSHKCQTVLNNRLYSYLVHYPMSRKTTPLLRKRHSQYTGLRKGYVHSYGAEDSPYKLTINLLPVSRLQKAFLVTERAKGSISGLLCCWSTTSTSSTFQV